MKRNIITIDEEKCDGCGVCIPGCPEGALQIINGKAKLAKEIFCDGLGACIKKCPRGAITIEQRDAQAYDEYKTMENISKLGDDAIQEHLKHLKEHKKSKYLDQALEYLEQKKLFKSVSSCGAQCGCPGSATQMIKRDQQETKSCKKSDSKLCNWPIQLSLMNPDAPFFENANLLICADCVPFSYSDFQEELLKDKILIMFCPKLDENLNIYVQKLTHIFETKNIQSVSIAHMEVPCCSGVEIIIRKALENAQANITVEDYTITISGEIVRKGEKEKSRCERANDKRKERRSDKQQVHESNKPTK